MGHSCGTLLSDTLVGHPCGTLLWDTLVGHSYGTLLWDTLVGHSCGTCGTLLWDTLVGHSWGTLLWDTLVGHSCRTLLCCGTLLWDTLVGHCCRKLLWDTLVGHSERFVRDFLQKSHAKSPKRAFRTRLPQKLTCQSLQTNVSHETSSKSPAETPIGAHTSRSPAKQFRDSSPSKRHPLKRQSQCDSDIHLYHNSQPPDSLHRPRIFPRPHV